MARVSLSAAATDDMNGIVDFIAGDNPSAAARWTAKMTKLFDLIASRGLFGQKCTMKGRQYRRITEGNYAVYYVVEDEGITVARVLHGARRGHGRPY